MTDIDQGMINSLISHQRTIDGLQMALDDALDRRSVAFALAHEKGVSSGTIGRVVGVPPAQAMHAVKAGRYILQRRRERRLAAA